MSALESSVLKKVNILLVDDQPGKLISYELILKELDENLLKANSAQEALEALMRNEVGVILIDVCMPDLDGFELAKMIREHPRFQDTAIIFVSAIHLTELDSLKGYELGGVDYVPVPVVPAVLRAKVRVFVDLYRKTRALARVNDELERRVAERTAALDAAAARISESEAHHRFVLESLPVAVYTCDAEGRVAFFNEEAAKLWGRCPEIGVDLWCGSWRIKTPDGKPLPLDDCPMAVAMREARPVRDQEIVIVRPDGVQRNVLPYPLPIRDSSGRVTGAINVLLDITERKGAETRQELLAQEVDHRARNALAVIQSIVSLTPHAESDSFAEAIAGRIRAMATAHTLLSNSRWEGADLLTLVNEELAPFIDLGDVSIDGESVAILPSVAQSLALVLHEMATNAAKYGALSQPGGRLAVRWRFQDDLLLIDWRESCSFAVPALSQPGFGSRVIEASVGQLGGTIDHQWRRDGLTSAIRLPRKHFRAALGVRFRSKEKAEDGPDDRIGDRRVLIVDDEPLITMMLSRIIEEAGANVVGPYSSAVDARQALNEPLDAAILDVNTGGDFSYDLADDLTNRGVPLLFVTGYQASALPERFANTPALEKPIDGEALRAALSRAVSSRDCAPRRKRESIAVSAAPAPLRR